MFDVTYVGDGMRNIIEVDDLKLGETLHDDAW